MAGASRVLVWRACMSVCCGFTGLRLKNTGLCIVYVPFWHVPLMMPWWWRSRTGRREDETRMSPEIWETVNHSTKDERQNNGNRRRLARQHPSNCFACWPVTGIGGGQHGMVSTELRALPFRPIELPTCSWVSTWCKCIYLVQDVCKYELFFTTQSPK